MKKIFALTFFLFLFIGCSHWLGQNGQRVPEKTDVQIPKEAGEYPKVFEKDVLRGTLSSFRSCYDVTFYDLSVKLNIEEKSIKGSCQITAIAQNDFDTLQVDLFENMDIVSIVENGKELSFYRQHNAVFIEIPKMIKNTLFEITIQYEGVPEEAKKPPWDGGFVWDEDKNETPLIGVVCEGRGASLWWPNKDHPSDEPDSMRLHITVPDTLMAIGNGQLESKELADNLATYTWLVKSPINNYNITLNVGDYIEIQDTLINSSGEHKLNHYVLSYNKETALRYFTQAREVIHFFEKVFGEYPFWKDGYKLVETSYPGMEHQSAIAYGNGYIASGHYYIYDLVDYIILHETAHEWWGNSLTACDGADVWLHESFATYSEVLYIEENLGRLVSIDYLKNKRSRISNKFPMVGPRNVNYWGFDDVYWRGAWVLHTLRSVINNDDIFFKWLKEGQKKFRHSVICSDEFIEFTNEEVNIDLNYFFQQYLFDRKPPVFDYYQDDSTFYYKWSGVHNKFIMPMDVFVNKEHNRIYPTLQFQRMKITKHSLIEVLDKEFYIKKSLVSEENQL